MERIRGLILKLLEQSHTNIDPSVMMATVELLQAELSGLSITAPKYYGSSKVAVRMPSSGRTNYNVRDTIPSHTPETRSEPVEVKLEPVPEVQTTLLQHTNNAPAEEVIEIPAEEITATPVEVVEQEPEVEIRYALAEEIINDPVEEEVKIPQRDEETTVFNTKLDTRVAEHEKYLPQEKISWAFDQVREVPTLAHQTEFKEMNDLFGQQASSSLNDRLKSEKTELASVLKEGPVRDLKKAIGVNDRFVFVNELFRGDEPMYERSIKTINNFRIYPEAEYWIERELKVKLGWDENKEAVKQFRNLVRRRFS